jgi:hypothetical protein
MKRILNNIIYHVLLLPAGITYFLVDTYRATKREKKQEPEIRHQKKYTVYPDDRPDFNKWISNIHNRK